MGPDSSPEVGGPRKRSTSQWRLYGPNSASRCFERWFGSANSKACANRLRRRRDPGVVHLSIGQEAVAAGVCAHLSHSDYVTSTHRGHGHCIAKGAGTSAMMAELFGKSTGTCKGKGGSMHIADFAVGMLGANGVVGGGIGIAVGAAQGARLLGKSAAAVCFFGDGAVNRGPFLEGLNWAAVFKLPVLFVCEDNQFSAFTRASDMTAGGGAAVRAQAIGVEALSVDGNDVFAVYDAAAKLLTAVRAGTPAFLHAPTYRLDGHTVFDKAPYRTDEEVGDATKTIRSCSSSAGCANRAWRPAGSKRSKPRPAPRWSGPWRRRATRRRRSSPMRS